jgi:hypothetical protein
MLVGHNNIRVEPLSATAAVAATTNHNRELIGAIVEERGCKSS